MDYAKGGYVEPCELDGLVLPTCGYIVPSDQVQRSTDYMRDKYGPDSPLRALLEQ